MIAMALRHDHPGVALGGVKFPDPAGVGGVGGMEPSRIDCTETLPVCLACGWNLFVDRGLETAWLGSIEMERRCYKAFLEGEVRYTSRTSSSFVSSSTSS